MEETHSEITADGGLFNYSNIVGLNKKLTCSLRETFCWSIMFFDSKMFEGGKKGLTLTQSFLPRGQNRTPGPVLCFCFMLALKKNKK